MPRPSNVLIHPKCMVIVWEKLLILGTHTECKKLEKRRDELKAEAAKDERQTRKAKATRKSSGKGSKPESSKEETRPLKDELRPSDELCKTMSPWKIVNMYGIYLHDSPLLNLMFVDRVCKETLFVMLNEMDVFEFEYKSIEPSLPKVELRRFQAYRPVITSEKVVTLADDLPSYGPFLMDNNILAFMIVNNVFPKQIILTNISELLSVQNKGAIRKRSPFNTLMYILGMEEFKLPSRSMDFGHMYITENPALIKYNPLLYLNPSVYAVLELQSDSLTPNVQSPFKLPCQTNFLEFYYNFTWDVTKKDDPDIPVDQWVNLLLSILRSFPELNTMLFDISISTTVFKNRTRMRRLSSLMLKIINIMAEKVLPAVFTKQQVKPGFHMPVRVISAVAATELTDVIHSELKNLEFGIVDTRQQNNTRIVRCSKYDSVAMKFYPTDVSLAELQRSSWGLTDAEPARRLEGIWFYFTITQHPRAQMFKCEG